jgi:tRNA-splicing ligase RtcB
MEAVHWAQGYALANREAMMTATLQAFEAAMGRAIKPGEMAVNCHHNYVSWERHYGQNVMLTRKGAVSAKDGELGIIPGSMGAKSFIVRGKGNRESFCSCSHGAGRAMSRNEARKRFTLADHEAATAGVECRKDADVIDETPAAYKSIDAVMAAQADLVDVVHTLKQVVCVKG